MKRQTYNPFYWLLMGPVYFYRYVISPLFPPSCRFHPTCSGYAIAAIKAHGVLRGFLLSVRRVLRCHPFIQCEYRDPVPERFTWRLIFGIKQSTNNAHKKRSE